MTILLTYLPFLIALMVLLACFQTLRKFEDKIDSYNEAFLDYCGQNGKSIAELGKKFTQLSEKTDYNYLGIKYDFDHFEKLVKEEIKEQQERYAHLDEKIKILIDQTGAEFINTSGDISALENQVGRQHDPEFVTNLSNKIGVIELSLSNHDHPHKEIDRQLAFNTKTLERFQSVLSSHTAVLAKLEKTAKGKRNGKR